MLSPLRAPGLRLIPPLHRFILSPQSVQRQVVLPGGDDQVHLRQQSVLVHQSIAAMADPSGVAPGPNPPQNPADPAVAPDRPHD
jgi:hypothetical protein